MANLCIIPARGGSKRIPGKNIKDFHGKPIIAYSIEVALDSNLFDNVMVSTDDLEIAEIAQKFGASVPFIRSIKNADDFASTVDVLIEVLEEYKKIEIEFDFGCCIYPTAPFTTKEILKQGYTKLITEKKNSVFPVVPFSYPVWRGLKVLNDGSVRMVWPENLVKRSQDLECMYHDAGQWYWFNTNALFSEKSIFSTNSASIVLNEIEVQDIDSLVDWQIAELKYAYLQSIK